jgi:hypothetical protein
MYSGVVLVCLVNVHIAWADGQFSGTMYYKYLKYLRDLRGCLAPMICLAATKYIKIAP